MVRATILFAFSGLLFYQAQSAPKAKYLIYSIGSGGSALGVSEIGDILDNLK